MTQQPNMSTKLTIVFGFTVLSALAFAGLLCGVNSIVASAVAVALWLIISSQIIANPWVSATLRRRQVGAAVIVSGFVGMLVYGSVEYERIEREGPKKCTVRLELMKSGHVKIRSIKE